LAVACLDKDEKSLAREEQGAQEWSILGEFIREKVVGWLN